MEKFIFLDHTADVKFQAFGKTVEECFENSARAMFAVMAQKVKGTALQKQKIEVEGEDLLAVLYNFLEELIFLMDTSDFFLRDVKVEIKKKKENCLLFARVSGGKASDQEIAIVVKAVTYNEMFVKEESKGKKWIAQVVVDV